MLCLFHWDGFPLRDRGPMVAERQWDVTLDGRPATLALTSVFFGARQKVLAVHFEDAPRGHRYLIYMKLLGKDRAPGKERFLSILGSIRFTPR
jgi:hypothetical protein